MKVLVTGAAGFLGSHLCDELIRREYDVIALDNFYTGKLSNIEHLRNLKNFQFVEADVTKPLHYEVDGIFNLACPASPVHYQKKPVETIRTSFLGALNCLELATSRNAKILQASTSEIYGDPQLSPQVEDYWGNVNPIGIRSCYDEGKRAAETLFFDFHREYQTRIKVARIFNTYGPRMAFDDGRVVSNLVVQALQDLDLTIYGDGTQTRSFCYVDDLILGLIALFESNDEITGPVNIGNPIEFTMNELAELVIDITGSSSRIRHEPLPSDDPRQRKPDITKAKQLLSWEPTVELHDGLIRTIAQFRARLG